MDRVVISSATSAMLNAVRGISALVVVLGHGLSYGKQSPRLMPPQMPWMQEIAVVAFFWISGFLVAAALDRMIKKGRGAREFIVARAVRVFLPLWPAIVFTWLLDLLTGEAAYASNRTMSVAIGNALAFQGIPWAGVPVFASNRPLWTVAIEWWLYVFAAAVVFRPRHPAAWLVGAIATAVVLHNLFGGRGAGLTVVWFIGAAGWLAYRDPKAPDRYALALGGVVLGLAIMRWYDTAEAYDWVAQIVFGIAASLIALGFRSHSVSIRTTKAAEYLAMPSYSLYLVHYPIMLAFGQPFGITDLVKFIAVSVVVALLFSFVFERPRQLAVGRILLFLREN